MWVQTYATSNYFLFSIRRRAGFFFLPGWLPRNAKTREKKESGIGPLLSSWSLHLSHIVSSFVVLVLFSPWLPRRVGLWMLSLSYLMPSTLRRQWRYQHIHSFQILSSPLSFLPRDVPPQTPKRAYQWSSRHKRKGKNSLVSRGFCCHCERILPVAVQIKSWLSMKSETLVYDLFSSTRRFITRFLFDKVLL